MLKKIIFLFILFQCNAVVYKIYAQHPISNFKHLTVDDGLSQNSINDIYQDKKGFMWFATQDGLNRFDGTNFLHYRNERNNPNSLSNNYIWDLYEDDDNLLWIATFGGGLNRLNLNTGEINHYKPQPNDSTSFPSNRIFSIVESPKGILWIGSNEGLIKFDKSTKQSKIFLSEKTDEGTLKDNYVGTVAVDDLGVLWLRTDLGLTRFNTKTETVEYFSHSPYSNNYDLGDIFEVRNVHGLILVACNAGLVEIDPKQKTDSLLLTTSEAIIDGRTPVFKNILPLANQRYAIATNRGLIIYNANTKKRIVYKSNAADKKSLSHSNTTALFKSEDNVTWVGTRNGLNRIESEKPDFTHIRHIIGSNGLSSKNVNSFIEENDSLLWVGTTDGLNLYNRKNNTIKVFRKERNKKNSLKTNYVLCLFKDSKGNKWIGTRANGFYKIASSPDGTFLFKHIQPNNADAFGTSIHYITEASDGTLWLGTGGKGLWKYDPIKNNVKVYSTAKDGSGPNHPYIFAILQDSFENIWLGTPTGGLNLFNPKTEQFLYFQNDPENQHSLSNDIILSLHEDMQNNLWIGTNGGLNKLLPKLEKNMFEKLNAEIAKNNNSLFTYFSQEEGFPNDVIYGVLEDSHNNLWASTNKGLVVFNTVKEQVIKTFDVSHGLQNNEFNQNGYYKAKNGVFHFGGVDGFNSFHPESIKGNQYLPPVVLTGLSLLNQPVKTGIKSTTKHFTLEKELHALDEISLSWKHDVISFNFAALSYQSPEKNSYSYILEGFNEDWVQAGKLQTATYTNLDSGDYVFRVRATNNSGVLNKTGTSLNINISTPPWHSWYAYILYSLILLGGFYLFMRYRINRATQKIKVATQIEIARTQERETFRKRSSQDFHDEAGTNITRIALITELAKQKSKDDTEMQEYLTQIDNNLQDLNNGMRDFIWTLDPSKDNLYDTFIRFTEFAGKFCEYGNIQFKSESISETLKTQQLNMSERRHLLLILKEALNNSVKHGKPSIVSFEIVSKLDQLTLFLKDNGNGFNTSENSSGNGLKNMKERSKALGATIAITSEENKGAQLQLTLETTQLGN